MGILKDFFSVLIPGGGAALRRKYFRAAAVMVVFLALLQAYVLLRMVRPAGVPDYAPAAVLALMLAVAIANAVAEGYHITRRRHFAVGGKAEELYANALRAYISGEDKKADEFLSSALSLDELNADLLFLRAVVATRLGKAKRARRLFRKCRNIDENGKWSWEIDAALSRL
jgi:tetratricopeptide (TPR) repeat protein